MLNIYNNDLLINNLDNEEAEIEEYLGNEEEDEDEDEDIELAMYGD